MAKIVFGPNPKYPRYPRLINYLVLKIKITFRVSFVSPEWPDSFLEHADGNNALESEYDLRFRACVVGSAPSNA